MKKPIILLLSMSSAVAQDINYNYDQSADFTKYKTYKWIGLGAEKARREY